MNNHDKETVFRVPLTASIVEKDPVDLTSLDEWDVYRAIYDKLFVTESGNGDFEGVVAKSWVFDKSTSQLRLSLRDNLKFSDGSPLTAQDVSFSIKRKILLTFDRNTLLPTCLGLKKEDLEGFPLKEIRQIEVLGPLNLTLHFKKCSTMILEELAGTNYAVVSPKSVGSDWRVKKGGITSGVYRYEILNGVFTLLPNLYNWRFRSLELNPFRIEFVPLPQHTTESSTSIDKYIMFLKSADPSLVKNLENQGFHSAHSLPSASMFLSLRKNAAGKINENAVAVVKHINRNLNRKIIVPPSLSSVYVGSDNFFPKDFNCGMGISSEDDPQDPIHKILLGKITLTSFRDNDYSGLLPAVYKAIKDLGYKVNLVKQHDLPSYRPDHTDNKDVVLELRGQHLSLRPSEVINLMVNQLDSIVDESGQLRSELDKLRAAEDADSITSLKQICSKFHHYNHIPIAHRRETFLARDIRFLKIFSTATANMHLEHLIEINSNEL